MAAANTFLGTGHTSQNAYVCSEVCNDHEHLAKHLCTHIGRLIRVVPPKQQHKIQQQSRHASSLLPRPPWPKVEAMEVEGDNKPMWRLALQGSSLAIKNNEEQKEKEGMDEVNENKKTRRGGRRGARGRGKKKLATKDPQLKEMLLCMAKLTLSNLQKSRIAMASLIPHDLAVVDEIGDPADLHRASASSTRESRSFIAVVEKIGFMDIGALY